MKIISAFVVVGAIWLGGCRSDMTSGRFERADLDQNGLISQAEAGSFAAANLFDGLDENRDQRIDFTEWNAAGNPQRVHNFTKSDRNNDGFLSEDELKLAAIRSRQIGQFIAEADTDKNGGISKREALVYYASKEGPAR